MEGQTLHISHWKDNPECLTLLASQEICTQGPPHPTPDRATEGTVLIVTLGLVIINGS